MNMSSENIGLALLMLGIVMYVRGNRGVPASVADTMQRTPDSDMEVDITRWRHDGTQPTFYKNGNGATFPDFAVAQLQPKVH